MKGHFLKLCLALAIFAGLHPANAAVTFTITPAAISNTYSGPVTLNITGITAGDTVVVQKFLDADSNSVLDSSAILWQQFQITDGQASVFKDGATSVTNFNVPCDTDGSANGSITASLYPAMDFSQTIIGKYFLKLSSPAGHFSPITNSFLVTNFPFAQSFSGNVVNNGTNVPDAVVILFQPQNGGQGPQGGVLANNSGAYKIAAATGTYKLAAAGRNFVANLAIAPNVALAAGATIVTNLPLINATKSISGQVVDANNSSIGISGDLVPLQTKDDLLAIGFTDTNGNFSAGVTSDQWAIQKDEQALVVKGYLTLQGNIIVDTTTGSVSGVTVALPRETAIFYGTVKSTSGTPLTGANIEADDNNSGYTGDGVAFTNGNYVAAAIGGNGDPWFVQYNQSGPANYVYSQPAFDQNGGTNINVGQAVHVSLTGLLATNTISGNVMDSEGNPVAGLGVNANATINTVSYSSHTDTDANGKYSLNVGNGDWDVSVNCGNGGDGLQNIYTNGNAQCPSDQFINVNSANTNANFLIQLTGGAIFGYVVDTFGNPIAGVDVDASDGLGDNFTGTTANNGFYSIFVGDNSWTVSVDCGELNALGYQCVADDNVTISDANSEADFQAQFSTSPTQSVFPFETLYGFSAFTVNGTNSDGANPYGGLALFGNTLYGTTSDGGTNNNGTIFGVATNLSGFTVAHTFTAANFNPQGSYTNSDGVNSYAGLVLFSNVFYGTAANGGTNGSGTVFKLSPNGTGFVTLRAFAALVKTNAQGFYTNADGANPSAGLIAYGGVLYGTTSDGGTNGSGTVFAVNTNGSGFQVLHNFTAGDVVTGTNTDGAVPYAGLVLVGNFLYGTAYFGGTNGGGTVFRLNTNGSGFATLYSFTGGDDGGSPRTTLVSSGNTLFGTAEGRGVWGNGTVFALNTNGTGFTILHSFTGGNDGYQPDEGLLLSSNILYGATYGGGNGGQGTLFALNTNTLDLTVLYSFTGGNDGANPDSSLLLLQNTLYGTAVNGGPNGNGTVFAISLTPLPPAPIVSSLGFSHGQFQMFVNNTATQTCTVQMSTNLLSTNWFSLLVTNPPAGSFLFTDTSATNKQRFYRVKIGP